MAPNWRHQGLKHVASVKALEEQMGIGSHGSGVAGALHGGISGTKDRSGKLWQRGCRAARVLAVHHADYASSAAAGPGGSALLKS